MNQTRLVSLLLAITAIIISVGLVLFDRVDESDSVSVTRSLLDAETESMKNSDYIATGSGTSISSDDSSYYQIHETQGTSVNPTIDRWGIPKASSYSVDTNVAAASREVTGSPAIVVAPEALKNDPRGNRNLGLGPGDGEPHVPGSAPESLDSGISGPGPTEFDAGALPPTAPPAHPINPIDPGPGANEPNVSILPPESS